jgi:hypothetical protein
MSRERGGLVRPGASRTGKPGTHGARGMMTDRCVHPVVHNDPLSSGTRWNARAGQGLGRRRELARQTAAGEARTGGSGGSSPQKIQEPGKRAEGPRTWWVLPPAGGESGGQRDGPAMGGLAGTVLQ